MMVTGTVYPWDLDGDPALAARARDAGVTRLTVAAVYHGVRAATPMHPAHRLVTAGHAAFYPPLRTEAWSGAGIVPEAPGPWIAPGAWERALNAVRVSGLAAAGWIVVTHSSVLGRRHPHATVRTAFGDALDYALCPSNDDVIDYGRRLAGETVTLGGFDRLVVEAAGALGAEHLGAHEKTAGADWGPGGLDLLSVCFCAACRGAYARADAEPDRLAGEVRAALDAPDSARAGLERLAEATRNAILAVRAAAAARLQEAIAAAAHAAGATEVVLHASVRREATGPNVWVGADPPPGTAVQLSANDARALGPAGVADYRSAVGVDVHVAENVAGGDANGLLDRLLADAALGADELSVGHLGLVGLDGGRFCAPGRITPEKALPVDGDTRCLPSSSAVTRCRRVIEARFDVHQRRWFDTVRKRFLTQRPLHIGVATYAGNHRERQRGPAWC